MSAESNKASSAKRLRIADIKLNSLLEITKAINVNAPIEMLLEIYRNVLQHILFIGKLMLLRNEQGWKSMLNYGIQRDNVAVTIEAAKKYTDIRDITSIGQEAWPKNEKFEIIVPVYHKNNPLAYVFLGDLNEESIGV